MDHTTLSLTVAGRRKRSGKRRTEEPHGTAMGPPWPAEDSFD